MVQAICKTNLDDYTCHITKFDRVPLMGEYVYCLYKGKPSSLKVVKVTHMQTPVGSPQVEIELHK